MDFKDSKTFANLMTAYQRELAVSAKYLIYEDIARQETLIEFANIYNTISRNNKEHARIWLRKINEGTLPETQVNLEDSIDTEKSMANNMYQEFSKIAEDEGFHDIAVLFKGVANIDYNHATTFQVELQNLLQDNVFCKPAETLWICMQCGNIMAGTCAPKICPVCGYPQGYYRLFIS